MKGIGLRAVSCSDFGWHFNPHLVHLISVRHIPRLHRANREFATVFGCSCAAEVMYTVKQVFFVRIKMGYWFSNLLLYFNKFELLSTERDLQWTEAMKLRLLVRLNIPLYLF